MLQERWLAFWVMTFTIIGMILAGVLLYRVWTRHQLAIKHQLLVQKVSATHGNLEAISQSLKKADVRASSGTGTAALQSGLLFAELPKVLSKGQLVDFSKLVNTDQQSKSEEWDLYYFRADEATPYPFFLVGVNTKGQVVFCSKSDGHISGSTSIQQLYSRFVRVGDALVPAEGEEMLFEPTGDYSSRSTSRIKFWVQYR